MAPLLFRLSQRYPLLKLELHYSDRQVNLLEEGFDLAVRIGSLADTGSLRARALGEHGMVLCAAAEYLRWQEAIPPELAKPFRAITTAWRTWRRQILAYFEHPITNAFTESFNAKIRKAYQEGNGYSFEVLRAKVLFTDVMQRKARRVEQVKVKRRPRFDELEGARRYFSLGRMTPEEPQYDVRNVVKEVTLGTDLSTLLAEIDHWPTRD